MSKVRTCDFCKKNNKKIWTFEKTICEDCLKKLKGNATEGGGSDDES